jgi:hypothetical protein
MADPEQGGSKMRLDEITAVLGPVDETLVAQINQTNASAEELARAWAWYNADEALINQGHAPPSGRVAELISLLEASELDREL